MLRSRLASRLAVTPVRVQVQVRRIQREREREREPTFTTPPREPPAPLDPQHKLAPTELPVEDYASPLLHTASFFSKLFRYSVYGSVGIVSLALTSLVAVHLYVEHSALAPVTPDNDGDDVDAWIESSHVGWSGVDRGGTDPRLGILARAAVRGAWISMHWASGSVASPLQAHSPQFGVATGPRMIGHDHHQHTRGTPVADSAWLTAEQYLVFALAKAEARGISLVEPADWERQIDNGGVDRACVELEERLAGVRERIGGRIKLEQAREGWHRIYSALARTPTTDVSTPTGRKLVEWEQRERVLASRKLGELGQRIAELWGKDSDEGKLDAARARHSFVEGITPVLGGALTGSNTAALSLAPPPPPVQGLESAAKHVSPRTSFFSFWSRSHPPSSTPAPSRDSSDISHLVELVSSTAPSALPPATSRAVLSSLVSLETFLARTESDLASAREVQQAALEYALRLSSSSSSSLSTTSSLATRPTTIREASRVLTTEYFSTRIAALQTHLAECTLARLGARASGRDRQEALTSLYAARDRARAVLSTFAPQPPETTTTEAVGARFGSGVVGVNQGVRSVLDEQGRTIRRDADKVDKIATGLIEFLQPGRK